MLNALKKLLQDISASVGKIGSRYDKQFKDQLESHIALAEKFIQETTGVTGAELARAAAGIDTQATTQATTPVASAENAQTTDTDTADSTVSKMETTTPESSVQIRTNPSPSGKSDTAPGEWGERHDDLANSGSKGVAELRKRKSGWIPNAWVRDDIGGIALPYGKTDAEVKAENKGRKTGYGLAHIDEDHPDLDWDLADDAIRNGEIIERGKNRIVIQRDTGKKHRAVVQISFDGIAGNWLVTAYEKVEKATESPANPSSDAHGDKGDATVTPENSADNTIPPSAEKSSGGSEKSIEKITSAKAGSRDRIMAFTELPDGEHTVNGKTFSKSGNAFTLDGKTLNAKEIEEATRTTSEKIRKTVEETMSDAEIGYALESGTNDTRESIAEPLTAEDIETEKYLEAEAKYGHLGKVWVKNGKIRVYFDPEKAVKFFMREENWSNNKIFRKKSSVKDSYYDVVNDAVYSESESLSKELRDYINSEQRIDDSRSRKTIAFPKDGNIVPKLASLSYGSYSINGVDFEVRTKERYFLNGKKISRMDLAHIIEEKNKSETPTTSDKMRGKGKKKAENKTNNQSEVSEKSEKSEKIPETIDENSSEKEVISFLESHYDRIDGNTKKTVFRKLVDHLRESPLHLKAIPQKVKVKSKKLFDALFPFANNKDARAAYTVVKVTDKEMTATDGKILIVAKNTSGVEPGAYSLKKRQIVKEEIPKYPDLSIITSKKYTDSTNADSLLTDGRVDGTVDIYKKLLDDGFFSGTAPVILKFGKSSIQVDVTNLKKVLDLFRSQGIENITVSSSTHETKFDSGRIVINNIIRIQGGDISAYINGLNPDRIGGGGGIAEIALQKKTDESGNTILFSKQGDQRGSIQRRDQTLAEIANLDMKNEITKVIEEGIPEGKYVFKSADDKQKIIDGAVKFLKDFSKKIVSLSDGRIAYFMPDSRAFERGSATAWAEYGIHAVTSSGKQILGKDYNERLFNQHKLDNLDRIVPTIKDENVFGKFDNKNPVKDGVVFVGTSHDGKRLEVITRLDEYGNPQADLTEVTVVEKNPQRKAPPLAPLTEVVEAVARHQEAGYSPSTTNNITSPDSKVNPVSEKNPKKSSGSVKFSMASDTQLTRQEESDLQNNEDFASEIGNGLKFSKVTDMETLDRLNKEEEAGDYLTLYRSVQIGPDGKLHSPMAAKVAGKWGPEIELGVWEQSDEHPELAKAKIAKDGKIKYLFDLNKGNGKTIGGVLYNPYIHSSNTMLNDQFSEAYQRPELVTVEVRVPKSELTSGYKAKRANDAVGMKDWKAGVVQGKLTGKRKVMLSRWDKPVRIVPDAEVAQHIKELIGDKDIAIPANVVTPDLRAELEKIGVKIDYSVKEYVAEKEKTEVPELKFSKPGDMVSAQDKEYSDAVKRGDMETAQKMVENAAKRAGYTIKAYHGTEKKFTGFRKGEKKGWLGKGIYFADNKKYAKTNGKNVVSAYLSIKNPYIAQANSPDGFFTEVHKKYPEDNNYDIAEILQKNGYDGIVYNHWDSDIGKITVVFDPEQIKSADPVVYDNKGNVIPLSERFNPEKNDIRFSKPGDGFTDPESTQTEVEEKIDRESEKLTDPKLTAEEREKRKEVIRTEGNVILETLKHFFGWALLGIKKARSSYYTDDRSNDITLMGTLLRTPIWLAKKFKGTIVESIVNAALTLSHDKNNIFQYLGGETSRKIKKFRSRSAWFRILYDVRT